MAYSVSVSQAKVIAERTIRALDGIILELILPFNELGEIGAVDPLYPIKSVYSATGHNGLNVATRLAAVNKSGLCIVVVDIDSVSHKTVSPGKSKHCKDGRCSQVLFVGSSAHCQHRVAQSCGLDSLVAVLKYDTKTLRVNHIEVMESGVALSLSINVSIAALVNQIVLEFRLQIG